MSMDQSLPALYDELEKIAISVRDSSFRQTRRGRRPIRVHNMLRKETAFKAKAEAPPPEQTGDNAASYEAEAGSGLQEGP